MKRLLIVFSLLMALQQASAQTSPAEQIAQKIAGRMQDSLQLTGAQKEQLYQINLQLHNQKASLRNLYTDAAVLTYEIQKVENTRDSLYRAVLTDESYLRYKQIKQRLVNNN